MHRGRVAFIGSVGVPNIYGGFESFLESCGPLIASESEKVYITCDRSRYLDRGVDWNGIQRIFIPLPANGGFSVLHDLFAFFAVIWRVDVVIALGVSGGIFFPLFRLICWLIKKRLFVNVDGVEWRRQKYSWAKSQFLFLSDRVAQISSHAVIIDNEGLRPFLLNCNRDRTWTIAYPGDQVMRLPKHKRGEGVRFLTICRIEPENNCHMLLSTVSKSGAGCYTFVGNWEATQYGRDLFKKYSQTEGIELLPPMYGARDLARLREECTLYLHGHSAGGTNPSLVEMLFYDCQIAAFDCQFNRDTAGDEICFFADEQELAGIIQRHNPNSVFARPVSRQLYTRQKIAEKYLKLILIG